MVREIKIVNSYVKKKKKYLKLYSLYSVYEISEIVCINAYVITMLKHFLWSVYRPGHMKQIEK